MNTNQLQRQITQEVTDLPYYAYLRTDDVLEVRKIDRSQRVKDSSGFMEYPIVSIWEVGNLEEWEALREKLLPLQGTVGAYKIYKEWMLEESSDTEWYDRFVLLLALRGVSPAQADEMIARGEYDKGE